MGEDPGDGPVPPAARRYVISIRGRVGDLLASAFAPLQVITQPGRTLLRGPLEDQGALYGVLARIQALGLELEEVKLEPGAGPGSP